MIDVKWVVLLCLIVFQMFFIHRNLRTKKKTGLSINAKGKGIKITVTFSGAIFAVILISLFSQNSYNVFIPISVLQSDTLRISGCILLFTGLVIGILSARELGASWRVGIFEEKETELVQTGLYRFSRNPYFLSYFIMFVAFLLIIPSVVLLLLVIVTIFCFHHMVKNEEKHLENAHGSEYIDYRRKVGRYLPRFKRIA